MRSETLSVSHAGPGDSRRSSVNLVQEYIYEFCIKNLLQIFTISVIQRRTKIYND